jgi:ubiquinone/menaquinone biosynthesis C-methylase UbiE
VLFRLLEQQDASTVAAFGRNVHWGYWDDPQASLGTADDYALAAERLTMRVTAAAELEDGLALLDCGCGFGGTLANINERYRDMRLVGLNIDARQLARARREVIAQNGNTLEFIEADACDLPFPDSSFDRVTAVECIFHFRDRGRFFQEASRVLRSGGSLTLSDFIPQQRVLPYLSGAANPLENPAARQTYGHIDVLSSLEAYGRYAAESGMELVYQEDMTQQTLPTYDYLQRHAELWDDEDMAAKFARATGMLQAASRKGFLQYLTLSFRKA